MEAKNHLEETHLCTKNHWFRHNRCFKEKTLARRYRRELGRHEWFIKRVGHKMRRQRTAVFFASTLSYLSHLECVVSGPPNYSWQRLDGYVVHIRQYWQLRNKRTHGAPRCPCLQLNFDKRQRACASVA